MAPRLALALQDVAALRAGGDASSARTDPVAWAYTLRDAIALADPELVVAHHDPALEADTLLALVAAADGDWVDRLLDGGPLAGAAPATSVVDLVRTLAALPGLGERVVATVTAPAAVAALLTSALTVHGYGGDEDRDELTDLVADALAGLVGAYAAAGAALVIVSGTDGLGPLVRAAAHAHLPLAAVGDGAALLPASAWSGDAQALAAAVAAAGPADILLSDGPVPGDASPALLRAAAARLA